MSGGPVRTQPADEVAMMRVLVIGGTRSLGAAVVRNLVAAGCAVTVLSRNRTQRCPGATYVVAERSAGLATLADQVFDVVLDFIAYDSDAVREALAGTHDATYVLISSVWLTRLRPGSRVDKPISAADPAATAELPAVTRNYLLGKHQAEGLVLQARAAGRRATVLRLPIFFGAGEHTGRVEFYRSRAADGAGILCVDGGRNVAQLAWTEDLSRALTSWLALAASEPLWDAIAGAGLPVRELVALISAAGAQGADLVDVSAQFLSRRLPVYLEHEPLWRERRLDAGDCNIFTRTGCVATAEKQWLPQVSGAADRSPEDLRRAELTLIELLRSGVCQDAR
jgi:2'-hydroxyisoflavone reductase